MLTAHYLDDVYVWKIVFLLPKQWSLAHLLTSVTSWTVLVICCPVCYLLELSARSAFNAAASGAAHRSKWRDKGESWGRDQLVLFITSSFSDCSQMLVSINCLMCTCLRPFSSTVSVFLLHSSLYGGPSWCPVMSCWPKNTFVFLCFVLKCQKQYENCVIARIVFS